MRFASSAMMRPLSNSADRIIDFCTFIVQKMLPQQCQLCTAPTAAGVLCDECRAQLPRLAPLHCPQCAMPTPHGELCGACLAQAPVFTSVSAAYTYAWPLAALIRQFKYAGNLALARLFAEAMCESITRPVDLIIAMPLAPTRLRARGFNQALELARIVSTATRTPFAASACRRVRDCTPQAMLPWRQRAKNIRGAFVCDADVSGMCVAVVDDVITTGSTLNELARTLRKAGAQEVHGWMVARTLKQD